MRRTIFSTMCMAVVPVLAASCNKQEDFPIAPERTVITAVAEAVGGGTKAHNQYSYDVLGKKREVRYETQ